MKKYIFLKDREILINQKPVPVQRGSYFLSRYKIFCLHDSKGNDLLVGVPPDYIQDLIAKGWVSDGVVNQPQHYQSKSNKQVIDYIEERSLGFSAGNALKYLCRAGRKEGAEPSQDFAKMEWYIERLRSQNTPRYHTNEMVSAAKEIADDFGVSPDLVYTILSLN